MLTDRQIKSLKTDRPQKDVFDGDISGFGVISKQLPEGLRDRAGEGKLLGGVGRL